METFTQLPIEMNDSPIGELISTISGVKYIMKLDRHHNDPSV